MTMEKITEKPVLEYPCVWLYKIIGQDRESMRAAIAEITENQNCSISCSNSSSKGKYHSLGVEVTVLNEEMRNQIYSAFKNHPAVKIVL